MNVSAVRKILESAIDAIETMIEAYHEEHSSALAIGATWKGDDLSGIIAVSERCRLALSELSMAEPTRNCDKFPKPYNAWLAYRAYCDKYEIVPEKIGLLSWLLAPADEPNDEQHGGAPAPDGAERDAKGETTK